MKKKQEYYSQNAADVVNLLKSNEAGLSAAEAVKRLQKFGYNELNEAKRDNYALIYFRQFKSPLIYLLLVAGFIVLSMKETVDALVIFFVLFFNATIGAIQEGKAQNTFLALKKYIKGTAVVLRDNKELMMSDKEVVVGDVINLREGEKVPADARLIRANSLSVNEAVLTGESVPKLKTSELITKEGVAIMNQNNMLFKGTTVVSGNGKAIVTATGMETYLGEIAKETLTIDSEFPLKNDIRKLSHLVIAVVILISGILFLLGEINDYALKDTFKTAVASAVSVIPEGLPIVITLVLAGGVWRMSKKNVLVKKMQAVEVLGEISVLAVDKTGTVTKNELLIQEVYVGRKVFEIKGSGYDLGGEVLQDGKVIDPLNHAELLLTGKIAALSGNAGVIFEKKKNLWKISGDPTEGAMAVFSQKIGFHREELLLEMPLIDEIPFDYELKFHASLHQMDKGGYMTVTGSPEIILKMSGSEWNPLGNKKITKARKDILTSIMLAMSQKGLRVIGFAYCETTAEKISKGSMPKLTFGGFFGIKDTLREEVRSAVCQVASSGIKVVMITGDHKITATSIAADAGIYTSKDDVLSGEDIDKLSDEELANSIKKVTVFARVTPNHKLKIIRAYQLNGIVVAMTGDGVNDALSLTAADIGISMGKIGTEVAKEASDIILLDDNFVNITHGVNEGRNIFIIIKKVVLYLFATSLGEVFVILGSLVVGLPMPILAAQILWLNLVTDGFLDMALAMEPREQSNMKAYKKTSIIDKLMLQRMVFMAVPMALGTVYLFSQIHEVDLAKAWTVSLTTLAVFQWFNAWNCRHETKSIFQMNFFSNKFLVGATLIVISLQLLAVYNPFFQKVLRTVPLNGKEWLMIILIAFSIVIVEEVRKIARRQKLLS